MDGIVAEIVSRFKNKDCLWKLRNEIIRNVELINSMEQHKCLKPLATSVGIAQRISQNEIMADKFADYFQSVTCFNRLVGLSVSYETWYCSSYDNQNKETARVLHQKKKQVQEFFDDVRKSVFDAQDIIEGYRAQKNRKSLR